MCGLFGFMGGNLRHENAEILLKNMAVSMTHRGPDSSGIWFDEKNQVGLGHRRLSILDLSSAGHQPMISFNERYFFVFNGEIYNHLKLREELSSHSFTTWRGHSDTETLLAGFENWGIQETIERTVGMFAFAVWDKQERLLTLGRDRLGEKPLYYGWQNNSFLFGSELKALKLHPNFNATIDRGALSLLLRYNTIPAPHCIWHGIKKLSPGCLLSVSKQQPEPAITTYWSGKNIITTSRSQPFVGSPEQAVTALDELLHQSIASQMIADVPVGAFLSGGVDSSTIVALMQAQSTRPIQSFSVGFLESTHNEAPYAMAVAKHLKTDHTELYVNSNDALAVISKLPHLYDEPFADSSQIPTFLVAQLAKQTVQVSLSGDAGDELFCGYNRYVMTDRLWRAMSKLPIGARRQIAKAITTVSPLTLNRLFEILGIFLPHRFIKLNIGDKLHKGAALLASKTIPDLYNSLSTNWSGSANAVLNTVEPQILLMDDNNSFVHIEQMMALDMLTYLPDVILTKVDRAGMGVSLETRIPFLDHRVVNFAWSLPLDYKLNKGVNKWVLREVLYKYVPKKLIERPKQGFSVPINSWLRGPLREWAEALLDKQRLAEEGFFDSDIVRSKWDEHLLGHRNYGSLLWGILMFQAWLEKQ